MKRKQGPNEFAFILPFAEEQREAERAASSLAAPYLPRSAFVPADSSEPDLAYVTRNVFSTLFFAVYAAMGIEPDRRAFYGLVNHAVRGLVTATDNILDDEGKKLLPLNLPLGAHRFASVMNLLLFQRVLDDAIEGFETAGPEPVKGGETLKTALMTALYSIGELEAEEEGGLAEPAAPSEIVDRVHHGRGGGLLALSMIAPGIYEKGLERQIEKAGEGIYRIGMALQMVDDLVDVAEDLAGRKNNYVLASLKIAAGPDGWSLPFDVTEGWRSVAVHAPGLFAKVVGHCLAEARSGFSILSGAGLPLDGPATDRFLKALFELRGAGGILKG